MTVELLYFDGCPNHESLVPRLRGLLEREGVDEEISLRRIDSPEEAERERFLGSPSLRVDGRDVEPGAEERDDFGLKCRLFRTDEGYVGVPPDEWVLAALRGKRIGPPRAQSAGAVEALRTIGITPRPFTEARLVGLSLEDRRRHRAILRQLAGGEVLQAESSDARAEGLARLAAADLIALDVDGEVTLAYPISAGPTRHRVELADGRGLWACCAIDALGIPAMLGVAGTVVSRAPKGEAEIKIRVGPFGDPEATPADAVVLAGTSGDGTTACCACPFINFFESPASADSYLAEHRELKAACLSVPEATTAARMLFEDLLTDEQQQLAETHVARRTQA